MTETQTELNAAEATTANGAMNIVEKESMEKKSARSRTYRITRKRLEKAYPGSPLLDFDYRRRKMSIGEFEAALIRCKNCSSDPNYEKFHDSTGKFLDKRDNSILDVMTNMRSSCRPAAI